jgi:protein-L-isoaspartate O-methyltransferase
MTQALDVNSDHRVLEIGTGSGYQAAVLGTLAKEVYTIEIVSPLAERARQTLSDLGLMVIPVGTLIQELRVLRREIRVGPDGKKLAHPE